MACQRKQKEDCRRFYWSEFQRPHKMLNGHRSITLNSHRKNKWLRQRDSKKTRQNNKRRDTAYRTMQSVLTTAAMFTTIIATAGRLTLRLPTTEDFCIQKRKGARTTEKYAQPLMKDVSPIHGYDLHLSGPSIQSLQTITVSVANEKSKWQDIEQKQKPRMASNSHVRPEQSGRVRKLANEA